MEDPWQFLILDRHTATERDVKAAYARLLKQHRPDQDPEGFQKLRQAYEAALAGVARRDAGQAQEAQPSYAAPETSAKGRSNAVPDVLPFREEMLPDSVREVFSVLKHSVGSGNEEQMQAAVASFQAACQSANVPVSVVASALQDAFQSDAKLTARGITDEVMVQLAEKGQINFCHVVVSAWETDDNRMRMASLGASLLKRSGLLATQDGSLLMARVGMLSGLEFPQVAAALGNAAFPHLPVEGREQFIGQLEQQVLLGRIFSDVSPETRPFWFRMLRKNAGERDWSTQEAQRALKTAMEQNRFGWKGWGIVRQIMPPEQWADVERFLQQQAQRLQGTSGAGTQRSAVWATTVVGIFIAMIFVGRFANLKNERDRRWDVPPATFRQPPPRYDFRTSSPDRSPNFYDKINLDRSLNRGTTNPGIFPPANPFVDTRSSEPARPSSIYDRINQDRPLDRGTGSSGNFPPVKPFVHGGGAVRDGVTSLGPGIEPPSSLSNRNLSPTVTINNDTPLAGVTPVPAPASPPKVTPSPSAGPSIDDVIKGAQQKRQGVIITLPSGEHITVPK